METKPMYALVKDLFFATKMVKTAEAVGLQARAFDTASRLVQAAREKAPSLILIDCEGLEREAFQLLQEFRSEEKLSAVPRIGYLSHRAKALKQEMQNAGCAQVYVKSEFVRELKNLIGRYGHGLPSRI